MVVINKFTDELLKSSLKAITLIVDNEIPATKEEVAFLFSLMTYLANSQRHNTEEFALPMSEQQASALWHCCNVVVRNNITVNQGHLANAMQVMSLIAPVLDKLVEDQKNQGVPASPTQLIL